MGRSQESPRWRPGRPFCPHALGLPFPRPRSTGRFAPALGAPFALGHRGAQVRSAPETGAHPTRRRAGRRAAPGRTADGGRRTGGRGGHPREAVTRRSTHLDTSPPRLEQSSSRPTKRVSSNPFGLGAQVRCSTAQRRGQGPDGSTEGQGGGGRGQGWPPGEVLGEGAEA
jgi:hypothetical protein